MSNQLDGGEIREEPRGDTLAPQEGLIPASKADIVKTGRMLLPEGGHIDLTITEKADGTIEIANSLTGTMKFTKLTGGTVRGSAANTEEKVLLNRDLTVAKSAIYPASTPAGVSHDRLRSSIQGATGHDGRFRRYTTNLLGAASDPFAVDSARTARDGGTHPQPVRNVARGAGFFGDDTVRSQGVDRSVIYQDTSIRRGLAAPQAGRVVSYTTHTRYEESRRSTSYAPGGTSTPRHQYHNRSDEKYNSARTGWREHLIDTKGRSSTFKWPLYCGPGGPTFSFIDERTTIMANGQFQSAMISGRQFSFLASAARDVDWVAQPFMFHDTEWSLRVKIEKEGLQPNFANDSRFDYGVSIIRREFEDAKALEDPPKVVFLHPGAKSGTDWSEPSVYPRQASAGDPVARFVVDLAELGLQESQWRQYGVGYRESKYSNTLQVLILFADKTHWAYCDKHCTPVDKTDLSFRWDAALRVWKHPAKLVCGGVTFTPIFNVAVTGPIQKWKECVQVNRR